MKHSFTRPLGLLLAASLALALLAVTVSAAGRAGRGTSRPPTCRSR